MKQTQKTKAMTTKRTKKTFDVSANFEHMVDFIVRAYSGEEAMRLVEKHQFDGEIEYRDGDFGGLLGVQGYEEKR